MNQNEIICILCNYFTDLATIICINILRFSRCFYHINISKISVDWQSRGHGFEPRYHSTNEKQDSPKRTVLFFIQ